MKTLKIYQLLIFVFVLDSCNSTLKLTLDNKSDFQNSYLIEEFNKKGMLKRTIVKNQIDSNKVDYLIYPVRKGRELKFTSQVNTAVTNENLSRTVDDLDTTIWKITISGNEKNVLDLSQAEKFIRNSIFTLNNWNIKFDARDLSRINKKYFGALVAMEFIDSLKTAKIVDYVQSSHYYVGMDDKDIKVPIVNIEKTICFEQSFAGDVKASYPIISSFSTNTTFNKYYKLEMDIDLAGWTDFDEPDTLSHIEAINNLEEKLNNRLFHLASDTTRKIKIFFIDRIFVIKSANFETNEIIESKTNINISSAEAFNGKGAYILKSGVSDKTGIVDLVFDLDGMEVNLVEKDSKMSFVEPQIMEGNRLGNLIKSKDYNIIIE
jgi:hypothetical protein